MLFAEDILETLGNAMMNPFIIIPLVVLLLGLVGLMIFMRMKKKDEDE